MTEHLDWLTIWREINIFLAITGLFMVIYRIWQLRRWWYPEERYFAGANALFAVAAIATSLEGIHYDLPFGWRVPLLSVASMWLVYSSIQKPPRLRFGQTTSVTRD